MNFTPEADSVPRKPLVSIILPAYNSADFLEAAIARLLTQSCRDFEIVVVDDGSTDATAQLGAHLAGVHDRVQFLRLEINGGVAGARAFGVKRSHGQFIWFVDVDDSAPPAALERLIAAAETTGADLIIGSAEMHTQSGAIRLIAAPPYDGPVTGLVAFAGLLCGKISGHLWNKLIRRSVAEAIDFTPATVHSDLAMTGQLLVHSHTVAAIPDIVYCYRLRSGSIVHSGRRRDESLRLLEVAITGAAQHADPDLVASVEFRYFVLRYIVLSGIKDALLYPYSSGERQFLLRQSRLRLTWRQLDVFLHFGDPQRLLLAVTAKTSVRLHRQVLKLAGSRGN